MCSGWCNLLLLVNFLHWIRHIACFLIHLVWICGWLYASGSESKCEMGYLPLRDSNVKRNRTHIFHSLFKFWLSQNFQLILTIPCSPRSTNYSPRITWIRKYHSRRPTYWTSNVRYEQFSTREWHVRVRWKMLSIGELEIRSIYQFIICIGWEWWKWVNEDDAEANEQDENQMVFATKSTSCARMCVDDWASNVHLFLIKLSSLSYWID